MSATRYDIQQFFGPSTKSQESLSYCKKTFLTKNGLQISKNVSQVPKSFKNGHNPILHKSLYKNECET